MDSKIINEKILEVFIECNIQEFPINCFEILQHYNFRLFTYDEIKLSDPELFAIAKEYSDDAFKYKNIICYNNSKSESRIRFSLMHELGHFILNHKNTTPDHEDEADYFASCVLAPRAAIWRSGCRTAEDIHNMFGLSYSASNRALVDFQKWRYGKIYDCEKELGDMLYSKKEPTDIQDQSIEKKYQNKKRWKEIEERNRFIEENICDLSEYALMQYERSLHLGHVL